MKIKKVEDFEEINENMNDKDSLTFNLKRLRDLGYFVNIKLENNRIVLTDKNGYNLMNTNNNQLGVSSMSSFIAGLYFGVTLEK